MKQMESTGDRVGRARFSLLVALAVASAASAASPDRTAAQVGEGDREAALTDVFSDLAPGTEVRVNTPMLFIEEGSYRGLAPGVVEIEYGGRIVPVNLRDIRTLLVEDNHPVEGMLWGLGVGILAGSLTGLMVGSFGCPTPDACESTEREGAIRWGSVIGAAGAITGFVVGRHSVYWRPVFP